MFWSISELLDLFENILFCEKVGRLGRDLELL